MVDLVTVDDSDSGLFGKSVLYIAVILFLELVLLATLVPNDYIFKMITKENKMVLDKMGADSYLESRNKSIEWYTGSFVNTGFESMVGEFFIPTQDQINRSRGLQDLGKDSWFPWIKERGVIIRSIMHLMFQRVHLTIKWIPLLLILLIPAFADGILTWKIRQYTFDYPSPFAHRYAWHIVTILIILSFIALLAPIPMNPLIIPMLWMIVIPIAAIMIISNLPKKL